MNRTNRECAVRSAKSATFLFVCLALTWVGALCVSTRSAVAAPQRSEGVGVAISSKGSPSKRPPATKGVVELPAVTIAGSEREVSFDLSEIKPLLKAGETLEVELLTREGKGYVEELADFYGLADTLCFMASLSSDLVIAQKCPRANVTQAVERWRTAMGYLGEIARGGTPDRKAAASYAAFVRSSPGEVYLIENGRRVVPSKVKDLQGIITGATPMANPLAIEFEGCSVPKIAMGPKLSEVCHSALPLPPVQATFNDTLDKLVLSRQTEQKASVVVRITPRTKSTGNKVKKAAKGTLTVVLPVELAQVSKETTASTETTPSTAGSATSAETTSTTEVTTTSDDSSESSSSSSTGDNGSPTETTSTTEEKSTSSLSASSTSSSTATSNPVDPCPKDYHNFDPRRIEYDQTPILYFGSDHLTNPISLEIAKLSLSTEVVHEEKPGEETPKNPDRGGSSGSGPLLKGIPNGPQPKLDSQQPTHTQALIPSAPSKLGNVLGGSDSGSDGEEEGAVNLIKLTFVGEFKDSFLHYSTASACQSGETSPQAGSQLSGIPYTQKVIEFPHMLNPVIKVEREHDYYLTDLLYSLFLQPGVKPTTQTMLSTESSFIPRLVNGIGQIVGGNKHKVPNDLSAIKVKGSPSQAVSLLEQINSRWWIEYQDPLTQQVKTFRIHNDENQIRYHSSFVRYSDNTACNPVSNKLSFRKMSLGSSLKRSILSYDTHVLLENDKSLFDRSEDTKGRFSDLMRLGLAHGEKLASGLNATNIKNRDVRTINYALPEMRDPVLYYFGSQPESSNLPDTLSGPWFIRYESAGQYKYLVGQHATIFKLKIYDLPDIKDEKDRFISKTLLSNFMSVTGSDVTDSDGLCSDDDDNNPEDPNFLVPNLACEDLWGPVPFVLDPFVPSNTLSNKELKKLLRDNVDVQNSCLPEQPFICDKGTGKIVKSNNPGDSRWFLLPNDVPKRDDFLLKSLKAAKLACPDAEPPYLHYYSSPSDSSSSENSSESSASEDSGTSDAAQASQPPKSNRSSSSESHSSVHSSGSSASGDSRTSDASRESRSHESDTSASSHSSSSENSGYSSSSDSSGNSSSPCSDPVFIKDGKKIDIRSLPVLDDVAEKRISDGGLVIKHVRGDNGQEWLDIYLVNHENVKIGVIRLFRDCDGVLHFDPNIKLSIRTPDSGGQVDSRTPVPERNIEIDIEGSPDSAEDILQEILRNIVQVHKITYILPPATPTPMTRVPIGDGIYVDIGDIADFWEDPAPRTKEFIVLMFKILGDQETRDQIWNHLAPKVKKLLEDCLKKHGIDPNDFKDDSFWKDPRKLLNLALALKCFQFQLAKEVGEEVLEQIAKDIIDYQDSLTSDDPVVQSQAITDLAAQIIMALLTGPTAKVGENVSGAITDAAKSVIKKVLKESPGLVTNVTNTLDIIKKLLDTTAGITFEMIMDPLGVKDIADLKAILNGLIDELRKKGTREALEEAARLQNVLDQVDAHERSRTGNQDVNNGRPNDSTGSGSTYPNGSGSADANQRPNIPDGQTGNPPAGGGVNPPNNPGGVNPFKGTTGKSLPNSGKVPSFLTGDRYPGVERQNGNGATLKEYDDFFLNRDGVLSHDEAGFVLDYIFKGGINRALREGNWMNTPWIKDAVNGLLKIIEESKSLPKGTKLYRRVSDAPAKGTTVPKDFTSTSIMETPGNDGFGSSLIEITVVDDNVKGLYIRRHVEIIDSSGELEMILPPGVEITVTGTKTLQDGRVIFTAELRSGPNQQPSIPDVNSPLS